MSDVKRASDLFFTSLCGIPVLFFLTVIFSTLFIKGSFKREALRSCVVTNRGQKRVLLTGLVTCRVTYVAVLTLPLLMRKLVNELYFGRDFIDIDNGLCAILTIMISLFTVYLLPFFFTLLFHSVKGALTIPVILFFLVVFLVGKSRTLFVSQVLPVKRLQLVTLRRFAPSVIRFIFASFL